MAAVLLEKPFRRKRSADSVLDGPGEAFTSEEVAEHCTEDDCYIVINGKVTAADQLDIACLSFAQFNLRIVPSRPPILEDRAWLCGQLWQLMAPLWLLVTVCNILEALHMKYTTAIRGHRPKS